MAPSASQPELCPLAGQLYLLPVNPIGPSRGSLPETYSRRTGEGEYEDAVTDKRYSKDLGKEKKSNNDKKKTKAANWNIRMNKEK